MLIKRIAGATRILGQAQGYLSLPLFRAGANTAADQMFASSEQRR